MGFETPEEGYLAKILIQAGEKDVPIGKLVCIIVENESDVAAFKDFKDTGNINRMILLLKLRFENNYNVFRKTGASPSKAAAAPVSAPQASSAPTPQLVQASSPPQAPRPLTAVEQHFGSRVYASPMAKRLAETQALRLEGKRKIVLIVDSYGTLV